MKKILFVLCVCSLLPAITLEELKMQKRFGVGVSTAGPLSVMGLEMDINLTEQLSFGAGIGTGIDYGTWMLKARYFLLGKWVSPYLGLGMANWWTNTENPTNLKPGVLANRFISPGDDLSRGFSIWMVYPTFGVQFMQAMGIEFFVEVHWFFKLMNFANGTYAGMGAHWYL